MNSLEEHVLRLIGEDVNTPDVFGDITPVRDSINEGLQDLCMITGSYQRTYLLPLYANRSFYRLAWEQDHFGWITEVWDRSRNRRLTPTDVRTLAAQDVFWLKHEGDPDEYMQIGADILGVFYRPASNGIVLEIRCACIPKPYETDTDEIKVREVFQNATVYLATSEFYASRGNAKRAMEYLNTALETAGLMQMYPQAAERIYQFGGNQTDRRESRKASYPHGA